MLLVGQSTQESHEHLLLDKVGFSCLLRELSLSPREPVKLLGHLGNPLTPSEAGQPALRDGAFAVEGAGELAEDGTGRIGIPAEVHRQTQLGQLS